MADWLRIVHWNEYLFLLEQGSPPVGVQLLIANGILLIVWLVQRMRGDRRSSERSGLILTGLLLATNVLILAHGDAAFQ